MHSFQQMGNQKYLYRDDAAQPLIEELLSKGPLSDEHEKALERLDELRFAGVVRESYHKEAAILQRAIADAPQRERIRKLRSSAQAKHRRKHQENREMVARKARDLEAREQRAAKSARQAAQTPSHEAEASVRARKEAEAEADEQRRWEAEEAERQAELERIREVHRLHLLELEAQQQEEKRMRARWEALRREHDQREAEKRQAKEAAHRARLEEERVAKEAQEAARRVRLEQDREIARRVRLEQERINREAKEAARRAEERRAKEAEEAARRARLEEERRAKEAGEAGGHARQYWQHRTAQAAHEGPEQQIRTFCELYELKWVELKSNQTLKDIVAFLEFPFPVFGVPMEPSAITYERVREFVFHTSRSGNTGKTHRAILKTEVLRWHPDRFNALVRPKVREADWPLVEEAAGLVARCVTQLLADA